MSDIPLSSTAVNVSITLQTGYVTQKGFGTLLVVAGLTAGDPLIGTVRTYNDIDAVAVDYAAGTDAYNSASAYFSQSPKPTKIVIAGIDDAHTDIAAELDAIVAISDDWYGLVLADDQKTDQNILDAAAWIEAREKMFFIDYNSPGDTVVGDTASVAYQLFAANYNRTSYIWRNTADASDGFDASAAARYFTVSFSGTNTTITGKFKSLPGCTAQEISATQLAGLQEKNANVLIMQRGTPVYIDGRQSSGEWSDIIHGMDALSEQIRVNVFNLMTNTNKIPYTDQGVGLIITEVNNALDQFTRNGYLASILDDQNNVQPAYTPATAIPVAQVPVNDRAQRVSPDISWTARIGNAVHYVEIQGLLQI